MRQSPQTLIQSRRKASGRASKEGDPGEGFGHQEGETIKGAVLTHGGVAKVKVWFTASCSVEKKQTMKR